MSKTIEDLFHYSHLQLQERMRIPVAFHAEMMGDIMYLQQCPGSKMQRNLYKPSSKKSTDAWTATIGHCKRDAKSLRISK
jgi:hypothetical protein